MQIQILEPEAFPAAAIARLGERHDVLIGTEAGDVRDVAAVFTRLARRLDADFHRDYPALRWIVSPTTGLNHIDTEYFAAQGIEVISLRGRTEFLDSIRATSEHTLALVLALIRRLPAAAAAVRDGRWDRYPHKGTELSGKTVLIHGYGRIGRQVAALYAAFGCRVVAHDVVSGRVPADLACVFPDVLGETDILSIHLPYDAATAGIVDAGLLARLPARAIVINTARGEIVDQAALLDMLGDGRLAGAALDVLVGEPAPVDLALAARMAALGDRLIVTPHIAGFTHESLDAVETFIAEVFLATAAPRG